MGFVYFAPDRNGMDFEGVKALGLGLSFLGPMGSDRPTISSMVIAEGPGGGPGVLFGMDVGVKDLVFRREDCWTAFCGGEGTDGTHGSKVARFWVGYRVGERPLPEDLARRGLVGDDGFRVVLSDGNGWALPVAKALPTYTGVGPSGELVERVRSDCRWLSELGARYFEVLSLDEETVEAYFQSRRSDVLQDGIRILSFFYRVSVFELSLLEMITWHDALGMIARLTDWGSAGLGPVAADVEGADKKKD